MPEGPSIVTLKEALKDFTHKKVIAASGDAAVDFKKMAGKKVTAIESWGKHLLICFHGFFIRVHLMMFGTYRINDQKQASPRLHLQFENGEVNFYTCSVILTEANVNNVYDWERDLMAEEWNSTKAEKAIRDMKSSKVCDVLLDQNIFGGAGNIIKNEALFRARIHPASLTSKLPLRKLRDVIRQTHDYTHDFYQWKKTGELTKRWLIYERKECPRCRIPSKIEYMGKGKRITYFCDNCQVLYKD